MRQSILCLAAAVILGLLLGAGRGEGDEPKAKGSDSVVKVTAHGDKPGADGKQVITVTLAMDNGWVVYANPVGPKDFEQARTKVTVEGKKPDEVQVEYPKGEDVKDPLIGTYAVYKGEVAIKATVRRTDGESPLKLKVEFIASNADKGLCLLGSAVKLTVP
jgi:hypothetical protein